MVKLLMQRSDLKIDLFNSNRKLAFEAYAPQFGYDEAGNLIEKMYLAGGKLERNDAQSLTFIQDFSLEDRRALLSKD